MILFWLAVGVVGVAMCLPFYMMLFKHMSEEKKVYIVYKDKKLNEDEKQEKSEVQRIDPGFLLDDKKRKSFTSSAIVVKPEVKHLNPEFLLDDKKH